MREIFYYDLHILNFTDCYDIFFLDRTNCTCQLFLIQANKKFIVSLIGFTVGLLSPIFIYNLYSCQRYIFLLPFVKGKKIQSFRLIKLRKTQLILLYHQRKKIFVRHTELK